MITLICDGRFQQYLPVEELVAAGAGARLLPNPSTTPTTDEHCAPPRWAVVVAGGRAAELALASEQAPTPTNIHVANPIPGALPS